MGIYDNETGMAGALRIRVRRGVTYLNAPNFERTGLVRHLFTTRLGGVSEGNLGTMNLSFAREKDRGNVIENYRRVASVLGCETGDFVCTAQTHSARVLRVTGADRGKGVALPRDYSGVDALITDEPGLVLSALFADCVPLLFLDPARPAIGLAHSGWRGTALGIGARTVEAMSLAFGSKPEEMLAVIGPSICGNCYEVGRDVADSFLQFQENSQKILRPLPDGKFLLDLWLANERILLRAGLTREHITTASFCTCCHPDFLYSHRASGGRRGNFGAFLGLLVS